VISPADIKGLPRLLGLPAQKYFLAANEPILRNFRFDCRIFIDNKARALEPVPEITTEKSDVIMLIKIQYPIFYCVLPRAILKRFPPPFDKWDHRDQRPAPAQDSEELGYGEAIVHVLQDMTADDQIKFAIVEVYFFDIDVEVSALAAEFAGHVASRLSRLYICGEPLFRSEVEDVLSHKQALIEVAKCQQPVPLMRQTIRAERVEVDPQCQRIRVRKKSTSISAYRTGSLKSSKQKADRPKPAAQ